MGFTISVGKCSCENDVVDKDNHIVWEANGVTAQLVNTDILNPILKLASGRADCNYVKINDFGSRYYFVNSVESLPGGHCLLHCHVDVLYTYKTAILGLTCLVSRNEFQENPYLVDTLLPVEKQFTVYSKNKGASAVLTAGGIYTYFLVKIAN